MAAVHEEATLSPSPCWINQLPNELKLKIAQDCYDEDAATAKYKRVRFANSGGPLAGQRYCKTAGTDSLGALFCTSVEWSTICAPLRFKVLNYWPGRWISFGRSFDFLNRRGALVEEVNALCKYTEDFDGLVRSLPKMRNIKRFSTRSAELLSQ